MDTINRKKKIVIKRIVQFVLKPFRPFVDNYYYTIRSGPAKGLKRKGGFGFLPFFADEEEVFFSQIDLTGKVIYDVGANIGIMTILFARKVGTNGYVYSFEPNPDSVRLIWEIVKINRLSNVDVHQIAVGDKAERGTLVIHDGQIGTGSLETHIVSRFLEKGKNRKYEVDVFPLDLYIGQNKLTPPDFIKIDTEGYEFQCLLGMKTLLRKKHPQLFIEMHAISNNRGETNAKNVVELLSEYSYVIYSIRKRTFIDPSNYYLGKSGHLFCS